MSHGRIVGATLGCFVVLVALVGWKVVPGIEDELESSVRQALSSRGIRVASVTAEGRTIKLVGGPESAEERLALASVTRSVPGVLHVRSPLTGTMEAPPLETDPVRVARTEQVPVPTRASEDPASRPGPGRVEARPAAASVTPSGAAPEAPPSAAPKATASEAPPSTPPSEAPRPATCQARLTVLAEGRSIPFGRGEATLADRDRAVLEEVGAVMRGCGEWALTIVGYADEDEGADAWALADRRAQAVARFLSRRGVEVTRLATVAGTAALDPIGEPRAELYVTGEL